MTLQQLLGIELPIIQAPMAGVQGSALAVAVSNAGGLGSLPCALLSRDAMRSELAAIAAQTAKPVQRQLLLPHAARVQCGTRRGLESGALALLPGVRPRSGKYSRRAGPCTVRCRGRGCCCPNSSPPS